MYWKVDIYRLLNMDTHKNETDAGFRYLQIFIGVLDINAFWFL